MRKAVATTLMPPLAACRYGCKGCCAAPIGVFWLTGIVGIIYGLLGGPLDVGRVSWPTVGLGVVLWLIASVWAMLVIRGADADKCHKRASTLCRTILPDIDEPDPMDEVRRAR